MSGEIAERVRRSWKALTTESERTLVLRRRTARVGWRIAGRRTPNHAATAALLSLALLVAVALLNSAVLAGGTAGDATRRGALPADCVLVVGNAVEEDGTPSTMLLDRLEEALLLYRSGRARGILVSGGARDREPAAMRAWLIARGVPAAAVAIDPGSVDTYSSVWRAKHVFGVSRLVIVSQRFHLPRAVWLARQLGLDVDGVSADRRRYGSTTWLELREVLSRPKAVFDVALDRG